MKQKKISNRTGRILSIQIRRGKGGNREFLKQCRLIEEIGLEDDVYGGAGSWQVSLLSIEGIRKQPHCPKFKKRGDAPGPGDFSENITTEGLVLSELHTGDQLRIGTDAVLLITEKGRACFQFCATYKREGGCPVPEESVFARVGQGGDLSAGDGIVLS